MKTASLAVACALLVATAAEAQPPAEADTTAAEEAMSCTDISQQVNAMAAEQQVGEGAAARQSQPRRNTMMFGLGGALMAGRAGGRSEKDVAARNAAAASAEARTQRLTALYARKGC